MQTDASLQDLVKLLQAKEVSAQQEAAEAEKNAKDLTVATDAKRDKFLQIILLPKRLTYLEIGFYNALTTKDRETGEYIHPDDAIDIALEQQKDLNTSLLEFNALMAGFQFIGLSMGEAPSGNVAVAWYFVIILGFGGAASAALIAFLALLFNTGLKNEESHVALEQYLKFGKFFFASQILSIGQTFCLMIGVNIMVHEFFDDVDKYPCWVKGSMDENDDGIEVEVQDVAFCGPVPALAWILNGISIVMFVFITALWYKSILAKLPGRKVFDQLKRMDKGNNKPSPAVEVQSSA